MAKLQLWDNYTRKDVHSIFSPWTIFTPQAGTWGLQGMIPIPARTGDWVFFVTFGQSQGHHVFDESITEEGVLSWQSQPRLQFADAVIQQLIHHDSRLNNIHLFLRTKRGAPYTYFGKLGYLTHDASRQKPVHFQWQLLDWPAPPHLLKQIGLHTVPTEQVSAVPMAPGLSVEPVPTPKKKGGGVTTTDFHHHKAPDYAAQDAKNRALGLAGELLVLAHEKDSLIAAGRQDLADQIVHVSVVEGDGAGYDIRSFRADGRVRYIEVKTTRGAASTSFYISPNEIEFSVKNSEAYCLYRVFAVDTQTSSGKLFILAGNLRTQLKIVPTAYCAEVIGA